MLFFLSSSPYDAGTLDFYKFWLGDLIAPTILYVMAFTWLLFVTDVIVEWGEDDTAYSGIEPILISVLYGLFSPFAVLTVTGYSDRAILYFDDTKLEEYELDKAEKAKQE